MTATNTKDYVDYVNGDKGNGFTVRDRLFYLLVGGGIGAVVGLMMAPKSGADLRGDIVDLSKIGIDQTKDLAKNLKERSAETLHLIKEKAETAYDLAASKIARAQDVIDRSMETSAEHINGEIIEASNSRSQKTSTSGRRSSTII